MDGENNVLDNNANSNQNAQNTTGQNNANQTSGVIDYNKIQEMIDGRNAKTEDSILKSYFEKQGLSKEEMESAITAFKTQRDAQNAAQNQNNLNLQNENSTLKAKITQMEIERVANKSALEIGVDVKTVPYLIKMADLSEAVNEKGEVLNDAVKNALNKVLEDLPQLKSQLKNNQGFQKIGSDNSANSGANTVDAQLDAIFGN